jgi:hypothetical protein
MSTIRHRTTFRNDDAPRDPAYESDTTSEQDSGLKPGVICPSDNRTKETNSLLQYITRLKIQRERKKHNPASARKWGVSQINLPVMFHHPQLPAISNMMRTQVDHGLSSKPRETEQDKAPMETDSRNGNAHHAHPPNTPELHQLPHKSDLLEKGVDRDDSILFMTTQRIGRDDDPPTSRTSPILDIHPLRDEWSRVNFKVRHSFGTLTTQSFSAG